jgi:hypothetical protein
MSEPSAYDRPDRSGRQEPGVERWLIALPLVVAIGMVIAFLLGVLVAVIVNGG